MSRKKLTALLLSLIVCVSMIASVGVQAASKTVTGTTIASYAKDVKGSYKRGGTGPSEFDASGFVIYTYKNAANVDVKKVLGRTCQQMYNASVKKKLTTTFDKLAKGDLVFYGKSKTSVSFVGIYLGNNKVVCVSGSKGVTQAKIKSAGGSALNIIGYASASAILKQKTTTTTTTTVKETTATTTAEETTTTKVEASEAGKKIVAAVKKLEGKSYKSGGNGPSSFDASGLIVYTYKKATGVDISSTKKLGRKCQVMYNNAVSKKLTTTKAKLAAGDIVFYGTSKNNISLAGIYLGNNKVMYVSSKGVKSGELAKAGGSSVKVVGYASASAIVKKFQ
jgi:cell wall-associated NlpC family hydrolase